MKIPSIITSVQLLSAVEPVLAGHLVDVLPQTIAQAGLYYAKLKEREQRQKKTQKNLAKLEAEKQGVAPMVCIVTPTYHRGDAYIDYLYEMFKRQTYPKDRLRLLVLRNKHPKKNESEEEGKRVEAEKKWKSFNDYRIVYEDWENVNEGTPYSLGAKRNKLIEMGRELQQPADIFVAWDDDDFYPSYYVDRIMKEFQDPNIQMVHGQDFVKLEMYEETELSSDQIRDGEYDPKGSSKISKDKFWSYGLRQTAGSNMRVGYGWNFAYRAEAVKEANFKNGWPYPNWDCAEDDGFYKNIWRKYEKETVIASPNDDVAGQKLGVHFFTGNGTAVGTVFKSSLAYKDGESNWNQRGGGETRLDIMKFYDTDFPTEDAQFLRLHYPHGGVKELLKFVAEEDQKAKKLKEWDTEEFAKEYLELTQESGQCDDFISFYERKEQECRGVIPGIQDLQKGVGKLIIDQQQNELKKEEVRKELNPLVSDRRFRFTKEDGEKFMCFVQKSLGLEQKPRQMLKAKKVKPVQLKRVEGDKKGAIDDVREAEKAKEEFVKGIKQPLEEIIQQLEDKIIQLGTEKTASLQKVQTQLEEVKSKAEKQHNICEEKVAASEKREEESKKEMEKKMETDRKKYKKVTCCLVLINIILFLALALVLVALKFKF